VFDVPSFLSDNHIQFWTHGKNCQDGWANIQCPHGCGDHSNHGGFNLAEGRYYCWKCGGHSLWSTIKALLPQSDPTAIIEEYEDAPRYFIKKRRAEAVSLEMPGEPLNKQCKKYLIKRGFDPDELEFRYGLKFGGIIGEWKYRILIPIYDATGRLVTWQGRDITGQQEERYKTLSIEKSVVNPKHTLYGIDKCKGGTVGVVEGPFDKIRLGDGILCTLGTSMTQQQIRLLSAYSKIVFVFDPEEEAQRRAMKYAQMVAAMGVEVEILDTGLTYDAGDSTIEDVEMIRKEIFGGGANT
jgi:hypothetical protein